MPSKRRSVRCTYYERVKTLAEMEAGCPQDHCSCGTHDVNHDCERENDLQATIRELEMKAGWDPNP